MILKPVEIDLKDPIRWQDISPWFSLEEILSPETIHTPHCIDIPSLILLNELRKYVDAPILVNHGESKKRGVRSSAEQLDLVKTHGAAPNSMHPAGKAFDITIPSMTLEQTAEAARDIGFTFTKIYQKANFVHIDNRNLILV